jgi:mevalonate kinase
MTATMGGSAFGKVILIGEHAVVYGVPAIVVGIGHGATAQAVGAAGARADSLLTMKAEGLAAGSVSVRPTDGTDLGAALSALLEACGVRGAVRIEAIAAVPAGAGLGCSAALGVAISRALLALEPGRGARPDEVAALAMAWERVFHGNPSGIDAAAAARGGCMLYRRSGGASAIEPVALARALPLAIGHTGIAQSTRAMVERVAELRAREPERVGRAFGAISNLSALARRAIEAGDLDALGRAMDENQVLLRGLGLSVPSTETLCLSAKEEGAAGVKLTGSGGGGCVVALCPTGAEGVVARWRRDGFSGFCTVVGANEVFDRSCSETG